MHVAVIMDGNGRWAQARGLPRTAGHRKGADAVRALVESAPAHGIRVLTLYAFSADNWARPAAEVSALLGLFRRYLAVETRTCREQGVRLRVVGRRDRLPVALQRAVMRAEHATSAGRVLDLRVAIDYSARDALVEAARRVGGRSSLTRAELATALGAAMHAGRAAEDVDLLIRTGGEQRLSDFLLWECAYAELAFTRTMWPDFGAAELASIVAEYHTRDRRFGRAG
ncbi:MAG TPA: polyprenyl diphosphate synthase [Longimicrobiales bacterium]|nr:polyprenyl diphosphate synthase [Longimicrobiales bacterium]